MKKPILATLSVLTVVGVLAKLYAGTSPPDGKMAAGQGIDRQVVDGKEKAATCAGCHGESGNSSAGTFPKLAGQHPAYLVRQLQAFKDGLRNIPVMVPMAAALSEDDMADIAAYYSVQGISSNPAPQIAATGTAMEGEKGQESMAALLAKGSNLYRNGNPESAVSACIACHGPSGEGNRPAAFPALRSQHADYLAKALTDFKTGDRVKDPDNMMVMVAKKMTMEEIKAVSYFITTLD